MVRGKKTVMTISFRPLALSSCALLVGASVAFATPKPKPKPKAKPVTHPKLGIKKTPQMAGGVGRFGEIYALKSGWTFQILGARLRYEPFDDYNGVFADTGKKLLVLRVAIKNNTPEDNQFNGSFHGFQVVDTDNETVTGGAYRLHSEGSTGTLPTFKPGQGAGQDAANPLEVVIPVKEDAGIVKIILTQGRKGSSEDVTRFFVAGAPGGDAKNVIAPLPANQVGTAPLKADGYFPSRNYDFRINGVTFVPGPVAGQDAPANRRFAVVNLTIKNPTTVPRSTYDFVAAPDTAVFFTDADGDHYPASGDIGALKGSSDEKTDGDIAPGAEKTIRLVFPVPVTGDLKTLSLGAPGGKFWTFDASGWK